MRCIRLLGPNRPDSNSRLLTFLAWHFPHSVTRAQIIEALWPEAVGDAVVGRLRVGLSRLRRQVRLLVDGDYVALDPQACRTDVHELRTQLERASDEPDPTAELRCLARLSDELAASVLVGEEGAWARAAQTEWMLEAGAVLIRTAQLALSIGELDVADTATAAALGHLHHDEEAWELRMTALSQLGRADEAFRAFAKARRTLRDEGSDFSEGLVEFAESVRSGLVQAEGGYPLSRTEEELLSRFFSRAMEAEPDAALTLLASSSFRPEVFRRPLQARRLLADALAVCPEPSVARERCHVRLIGALAALEEHEEAVAQAERFLAGGVADSRRRIALLNMSFSLFVLGEWDRALSASLEAAEIAETTGWPYDAWQCRCQHATYRSVLGEPIEAIPILMSGLAYFAAHPVAGGEQDVATIQTNLGQALLLVGRVDEALAVLKASDAQARNGGYTSVEALSAPLLGRALASAGETEAASGALIRGLRVAYREGTRRLLAKALADTARALNSMSVDADYLVRDWAGLFLTLGHRPTPMDKELLSRHAKSRPIESDTQVLEAVRRAIATVRAVGTGVHSSS